MRWLFLVRGYVAWCRCWAAALRAADFLSRVLPAAWVCSVAVLVLHADPAELPASPSLCLQHTPTVVQHGGGGSGSIQHLIHGHEQTVQQRMLHLWPPLFNNILT